MPLVVPNYIFSTRALGHHDLGGKEIDSLLDTNAATLIDLFCPNYSTHQLMLLVYLMYLPKVDKFFVVKSQKARNGQVRTIPAALCQKRGEPRLVLFQERSSSMNMVVLQSLIY